MVLHVLEYNSILDCGVYCNNFEGIVHFVLVSELQLETFSLSWFVDKFSLARFYLLVHIYVWI